jgi:dimethylargininase
MSSTKAIIREIPDSYPKCISSHPTKRELSLEKAREQHSKYVDTLVELGLDVIQLPKENRFPDSCFVEDNVVIYQSKAIITRMGAMSRRGEEEAIYQVLKDYKSVKRIEKPSTIEGGDVIHLSNKLISGLTQRTNEAGINDTKRWLGIPIDIIEDPEIVHLKSYITYVGNNYVVTTPQYENHQVLDQFNKINISPNELYGANTLTIGDIVVISKNNPILEEDLKNNGFDTISLDMSEFEKCEGALTCLSIIF